MKTDTREAGGLGLTADFDTGELPGASYDQSCCTESGRRATAECSTTRRKHRFVARPPQRTASAVLARSPCGPASCGDLNATRSRPRPGHHDASLTDKPTKTGVRFWTDCSEKHGELRG